MRHQSSIVTKDGSKELVQIRHLVQGTLATARALGDIDDTEFQEISNQTIESMTSDTMLRLSELAYGMYKSLWQESKKRVRPNVL